MTDVGAGLRRVRRRADRAPRPILWTAGVTASPLAARARRAARPRRPRARSSPICRSRAIPRSSSIGDLARIPAPDRRARSPASRRSRSRRAATPPRNIERAARRAADPPLSLPRPRQPRRASAATPPSPTSAASRLSGFPAWLFWCFVHIMNLVGFRNRAARVRRVGLVLRHLAARRAPDHGAVTTKAVGSVRLRTSTSRSPAIRQERSDAAPPPRPLRRSRRPDSLGDPAPLSAPTPRRACRDASPRRRAPGRRPTSPADEAYWSEIASAFDTDRTLVNLNNGGCSPTPSHVLEAMIRDLRFSNEIPVYHMWTVLEPRIESVRRGPRRRVRLRPRGDRDHAQRVRGDGDAHPRHRPEAGRRGHPHQPELRPHDHDLGAARAAGRHRRQADLLSRAAPFAPPTSSTASAGRSRRGPGSSRSRTSRT